MGGHKSLKKHAPIDQYDTIVILCGSNDVLKMSPDALIDQFRGIIKNLYLSL